MAPADIRKEGSGFDLPLALSILAAAKVISEHSLKGYMFAGELALDGSVRPVTGMLCKAIAAKELGIKKFMVPAQNARKLQLLRV